MNAMKETKSPAVSVICLLNPGLILIKFKAIKALYLSLIKDCRLSPELFKFHDYVKI